MSRAARWGLILLLGAVVLAVALWRSYSPPPRLPSHLVQFDSSGPGHDNIMRDELRALGSNAVPALVALLKTRSMGEILWIQQLRELLPKSLARCLPNGIDEPRMRYKTIWVLGELGPSAVAAVPALESYRDEIGQIPHHRTSTIIALAKIQPDNPDARSNLLVQLSSSYRFLAFQEFGAMPVKNSEELTPLISVLSDGDRGFQTVAAISLAQFGPLAAPAVPTLRRLLTNDHQNLSLAAAYALASVGPAYVSESLPVITKALANNTPLVPLIGPLYFKVVGPAAVTVLPQLEAFSDKIPGTWADRAVIQVSPQPSEKAIRRLGDHAELGPTDLKLLGSLGRAATPVVPKLQQIAEHSPYATLRATARKALEQIQAKPKPE